MTAAFDPSTTDVAERIVEATEGLGSDCSIECSGSQSGLDACVDGTRPGGTVAQIAIHVGPRSVVPEAWVWKDLTVAGIWSFKYYDTPRIRAAMGTGKLPVERIVTSKIDMANVVPMGIERLGDPTGDQVKILVSPRVAAGVRDR